MSSSSDRMRLKDKIIANIQKAIKSIHEIQYYSGSESSLVLSNSDRPCRKLCENLDHALLHGLHNVTHGYWRMVAEFTRKDIVKDIKKFDNVTTDLGRGRAWLFIALNENLLESYLRCIMDSSKIVKKFYLKEALVLDQQRMNVLLTLTAGLDFACFQLDYTVPYLDLSTYQSAGCSSESHLEEEDMFHRLKCFSSHSSRSTNENSQCRRNSSKPDSDNESVNSIDAAGAGRNDRMGTASLSVDSGCPLDSSWCTSLTTGHTPTDAISVSSQGSNHGSGTEQDSRIKRIDAILSVPEDGAGTDEDLEVIRVTSRGGKLKKKKRKKQAEDTYSKIKDTQEENDSGNVTNGSSVDFNESEQKSEVKIDDSEQGKQLHSVDCNNVSSLNDRSPGDGQADEIVIVNEEDLIKSLTSQVCINNELIWAGETVSAAAAAVDTVDNVNEECQKEHRHIKVLNGPQGDCESLQTDEKEMLGKETTGLKTQTHLNGCSLESSDCSEESALCDKKEKNGSRSTSCDDKGLSMCQTFNLTEESKTGDSINLHEDEDIYKHRSESESKVGHTNYSDMIDFIAEVPEQTQLDESVTQVDTPTKDYGIYLDNNALLHLMLNVFKDEYEQLQKMFGTREGHAEGQARTIFVVITDKSMYLLHQREADRQFKTDAVISFKEIDFVALSFGFQIVNIVCTNRRKQFWITTGDEMLTNAIVSTLSAAMEACQFPIPNLTVLTDATTQKICLRKYAALESKTEPGEVEVENYSLVFWEDPQCSGGNSTPAQRDGMLALMVSDRFGGHYWKSVYVVLKDKMLCIFNNKMDDKPIYFLHLGGDQCVGCRQVNDVDREHCIEIILSNGRSWHLSAASSNELRDWLQNLCQAVSEGMQSVCSVWKYQSCCCVLTRQKILMCHEDVQSSFFRTLGSANMEDVTAVTVDPEIKTYCVVEFESTEVGVSSEQWVLYFNSEIERNKFTKSLSKCWTTHFQVDITVNYIHDAPLQKKCQETALHLQQSLQKM